MIRWRRHYAPGHCDDCGWTKRVTRIIFWLNGAHVINAERIDFCEPCDQAFRAWLAAFAPAVTEPESPPRKGKP